MIRAVLRNSGIRPGRLMASIRGWNRYAKERSLFQSLMTIGDFAWGREFPILNESAEPSGGLNAYLLQDLSVARWIHQAVPARHIDVGSRIDGFVCNVATFREIEVIDIRPSPGKIAGVMFHQLDIMQDLPDAWVATTDSLSCLHTIEHFGMGRYGDAIDPLGHEKGLAQLKRMVAPGGTLYLSTPIGPQRIEFNAHRIFAASTLVGWFLEGWEIVKFSVIDDENRLREHVNWRESDLANHFGCKTGVGIIAAKKI